LSLSSEKISESIAVFRRIARSLAQKPDDSRLRREFCIAVMRLVSRNIASKVATVHRSWREDSAQGTFLRTFEKLINSCISGKLDTNRESRQLYVYLRKVTDNAFRSELKNLNRQTCIKKRLEKMPPEQKPLLATVLSLMLDEEVDRIRQAIQHLNSKDRKIIKYRFQEGMSYQEISSLLDVTKNCARTRINRAIGKLRRMLKVPS
jgi:RNA polymerase sigma factor (sigma-70 family)